MGTTITHQLASWWGLVGSAGHSADLRLRQVLLRTWQRTRAASPLSVSEDWIAAWGVFRGGRGGVGVVESCGVL